MKIDTATTRFAGIVFGLTLALAWMPALALGQTPDPDVQTLSMQLQDAQSDHLWRVAAWGGANVAGGLALVLASDRSARPARWSFGAMSAGWGAVNVGIAVLGGLAGDGALATTASAALDAERTFHDVLLLNLGLNVAYAGVGATMLTAGYRDVSNAGEWRGFGTSLILQGAGLLVLDGIAFVASRSRLADLLDVAGHVSARPFPTGVALTWTL